MCIIFFSKKYSGIIFLNALAQFFCSHRYFFCIFFKSTMYEQCFIYTYIFIELELQNTSVGGSWSTRLPMLRFRNSTNSKYDRVLFCELRFEWLRVRNLKLLLKRFLLIIKWVVKCVFIHNTYVFFISFIYDSNKWRRKWRSLFETIFNQVLTF